MFLVHQVLPNLWYSTNLRRGKFALYIHYCWEPNFNWNFQGENISPHKTIFWYTHIVYTLGFLLLNFDTTPLDYGLWLTGMGYPLFIFFFYHLPVLWLDGSWQATGTRGLPLSSVLIIFVFQLREVISHLLNLQLSTLFHDKSSELLSGQVFGWSDNERGKYCTLCGALFKSWMEVEGPADIHML